LSGDSPVTYDRVRRATDVLPGRRRPRGRFTVLLALRGGRPQGAAQRTVVHAADRDAELTAVFGAVGSGRTESGGLCERPTVTVLRPDDPAMRPDAGHEAVSLTVTVPGHAEDAPDSLDWTVPGVAGGFAERVVAAAGAAIPGLRERVLWREVRTPADTAADTGAVDGAVPGPALAGAGGQLLHPANATRLPGLYTVGGWSHPGGGLAHAGMSGALVAGLIVNGEDWRGSQ
jgi:phytoene dehydrogenase-like protein